MAKSFYKGEYLGSRPPCAICMGRGSGERARLILPGGVEVWLCAAHRSDEFQRRRAGRDLVTSLLAVWGAAGCLTTRRHRALDRHRARLLQGPPPRRLPGSYSWPDLRREAEERWARGERPGPVIAALRAREAAGSATPPSRPTMYRWYGEGRWLGAGAGTGAGAGAAPGGAEQARVSPPGGRPARAAGRRPPPRGPR